jgi:hypothetical protein
VHTHYEASLSHHLCLTAPLSFFDRNITRKSDGDEGLGGESGAPLATAAWVEAAPLPAVTALVNLVHADVPSLGKESALGLLELWAPLSCNKSGFMRAGSLDALVAAASGEGDAWLRAAAANVLHRLADYPPNTQHTAETTRVAQSLVASLRGWERPTVAQV